MGMFDAIDVAGSALSAQRLRMDVTAENLANAETTRGAGGGPYRRKDVVLSSVEVPGSPVSGPAAGAVKAVAVSQIAQDAAPPRLEYDPGHPDANAQGYVAYPNINPVEEMVDMITASRADEAGVTALTTAVGMAERALSIGK